MTLEEYRKQKKSVQRNPNAKTASEPTDKKKVTKYDFFYKSGRARKIWTALIGPSL